MLQAKFSVKETQAQFLNNFKAYGFKDKSAMVRAAIDHFKKEMELERLTISSLITTDPFLNEHLEAVLFDKEPILGQKASKPYLKCLDSCQVYLLLINGEYGQLYGSLSATHHEYRHAQEHKLPSLIFVKGRDDLLREEKTQEFFREIKSDGYSYKRFDDRLDLRIEIRRSLIRILEQEFNITPTLLPLRMSSIAVWIPWSLPLPLKLYKPKFHGTNWILLLPGIGCRQ